MATYIRTWFLALIFMAASARHSRATDLSVAIEEMQNANYFTFVVLVNLAPPDLIHGNLTFLMPRDKVLSRDTMMPQTSIADFLLCHSIPSPLLFEQLQPFPTGSILPTSKPGLFLNVTNGGGRRSFFLNNVRITSPNICTAGSSIRCHGIDGVIHALQLAAAPSSNIPPPPPPPVIDSNHNPSTALPPSGSNHHKSGSRPQLNNRRFVLFITSTSSYLMLLAMKMK